jgi:ABC-2 type transport system ATP-binding protein
MSCAIETSGLSKEFGRVRAVDSVNLRVERGEIYGFLGLNGAGKTTTIRMLLGMIRPTSGRCYLNGQRVDAGSRALWNRVGCLVEIPYSYPDLTVRENLEIIRRLRLIPDAGAVESVMEKLRIGQYADRKAKDLSSGNAQRLGLAKAIMHNPDILLLDEPANGLDPAGIVEIRELLSSLSRDRGVTIFISSHILGEISKFADRIGIIHEARLIEELDISDLEKHRRRWLLVGARDVTGAREVLKKHGHEVMLADDGLLRLTDNDAIGSPERVNSLLVSEGFPPTMLKVDEEDLETYFLRVVGRN